MRWMGSLAGLAAVFLWAITPAVFKLGVEQVPLPYLLVLRFSLSVLILGAILPRLFKKLRRIPLQDLAYLQAVLGIAFYAMGTAVTMLTVSMYVMLFSLAPLLTILIFRFRLSYAVLAPTILMGLGTLLFVRTEEITTPASLEGIGWLFLGMVAWILFTRFLVRFHKDLSDLEITTLSNLLCLIGCFVWWVGTGFPTAYLNSHALQIVVVFGLVSPLAFFAYSVGIRRAPLITIAAQYLDPALGVGAAWLFLGEKLHTGQLVGVLATVVGLGWLGISNSSATLELAVTAQESKERTAAEGNQ